MKLNIKTASLLVIIGIFGFSTVIFGQKTTNNQAKPKAGTNSATPKKAKNIKTGEAVVPKSSNNRPPSTGTGNSNGRPESTGETLSEFDLMDRAYNLLTQVARKLPSDTIRDNSGANASRVSSFAESAAENAYQLRDAYYRETNIGEVKYYQNESLNSMQDVKNVLDKALGYLNRVEYGFRNNKADAIEKTEQAIAQAQTYIENPPPPTKNAPNGAAEVKGKGNRKISDGKKAVNSNTIDSSLKTAPAGSTEKTTPTKNTNTKPKASGNVKKPTNNLGAGDDPFGKTPKKPKVKENN